MAKKNQNDEKKSKFTMTNQDKLLFNNLAKTGRSRQDTLNTYVSDVRLKRMRQEGFIKMEKAFYKGEYYKTYVLTDKGRNYVKTTLSEVSSLYKKVNGDGWHDVALSEAFSKLSKEQQLAARTEGDLIMHYKGAEGIYSAPDLYVPSIEVNGVVYEERAIEIITVKYTKARIEAKQRYCRDLLKTNNIELIRI